MTLPESSFRRGMTRAVLPLLALAAAPAQSIEDGYGAGVLNLPAGSHAVLSLSGPDAVAYFTGTDLVLEESGGRRTLLTLPSSVFGSFTVEISPGLLLFGENSNGELWLVPRSPTGGSPRRLAVVPFNYDAVPMGAHALVSAKTGGFGAPDNELVAVDLATGQTDLIARIAGASGPLAAAAGGGAYYATASNSFPAPPGSTDVLLFSASKLASALGPTQLTAADATVVAAGLDSAGSLAVDADQDLFATDFVNGAVVEVSRGPGGGGRRSTLVSYPAGGATPTGVQLVAASGPSGPGVFEPFQPGGPETLVVHETDFVLGTSLARTLAPARPRTASSRPNPIPPGPFDLVTLDGPPGGFGLLAVGVSPAPGATPIAVPGFEQPIFWEPGLASAFNTFAIAFDANGRAALQLVNPGLAAPFALAAQVAFADRAGNVLGSAPAVDLVIN